jgi:hypothetical protein
MHPTDRDIVSKICRNVIVVANLNSNYHKLNPYDIKASAAVEVGKGRLYEQERSYST